MPSSNPEAIPVILDLAWRLGPSSVLDIGAGYGKYGVLFREYLELRHQEGGKSSSAHADGLAPRAVRVDAVEGFASYINQLHGLVYDHVYVKKIEDFIADPWRYDLVFMGDILEHIEKATAVDRVIPELLRRANMGVLISVPWKVEEQAALFGNELEVHRSHWAAAEFRRLAPVAIVGRKGSHLIAFLSQNTAMRDRLGGNSIRGLLRRLKRALTDAW